MELLPKGVRRLSAPKMSKYETIHLNFLKRAMGLPICAPSCHVYLASG